MAEIILNGSAAAAGMTEKLTARCAALRERGIEPCLAIVRVGERPDDMSYERAAMKRCAAIGIRVKSMVMAERVSQEELTEMIQRLNADASVHGVLMFRPLPRQLDERAVCEALCPEKDVDGITALSMAAVYSGSGAGFSPCTAQAVIELLKFYGIPIAGRRAAVVGRSLVTGRPAALLLMRENATVTLCHTRTSELAATVREADIVVAAAGQINALRAECFRAGQTVIDIGVNMDETTGKLVGDVDYKQAEKTVYAISPVPGGVGAVTTSVLASHVIETAERY